MPRHSAQLRNRTLVLGGLGVALLVAVFVSPFASQHPDGLDRVSQDLKFNTQEAQNKPAHKLPFYAVFDEYALKGVPEHLATPLAGLVGTLVTFSVAWGMGKLVVRRTTSAPDDSSRIE